MNLTNNKAIIAFVLLLIIVFIINRETFVTTKKKVTKKVTKKIIPKKVKIVYKIVKDLVTGKTKKIKVRTIPIFDVQLTTVAPAIQTDGVNITPLQYTVGSVEPTIVSSSTVVPSNITIIPSSSEEVNNYQQVSKTEISITNDILKPIGNFIVDTIKNPPAPTADELQKPKKEISITQDIINPVVNVVNVVTNQIKQTVKTDVYNEGPLAPLNQPVVETPVNQPVIQPSVSDPQPNISMETENLFLLQPIELNNVAYYDVNPNVFKNIDFIPDGEKYLNLNKVSNNQYNFGIPEESNFEVFSQDINNISTINDTVSVLDNTNSIVKENNLVITGFNDKNKDLVISGITQTNKI